MIRWMRYWIFEVLCDWACVEVMSRCRCAYVREGAIGRRRFWLFLERYPGGRILSTFYVHDILWIYAYG